VVLVIVASVLLVASPVPQLRGISAFVAAVPPPPPPPPPAPPQKVETRHVEPRLVADTPEDLDSGSDDEFDTPPSVVVGGLLDSPVPPPLPPPPPPLQPAPAAPVRVGGAIGQPTLLTRVGPVYPQLAVQAQVEGVVVLETVIDREGRVEDVRVLRSISLLDKAAVEAVKQWRYAPLLVNGHAVRFILTVTVTFALSRQ
jgi:protein TonB